MVGDCARTIRKLPLDFFSIIVDVIGIVKSVSPLTFVLERGTKKPLSIVRLLLSDSYGDVEVNLWNEMVGWALPNDFSRRIHMKPIFRNLYNIL